MENSKCFENVRMYIWKFIIIIIWKRHEYPGVGNGERCCGLVVCLLFVFVFLFFFFCFSRLFREFGALAQHSGKTETSVVFFVHVRVILLFCVFSFHSFLFFHLVRCSFPFGTRWGTMEIVKLIKTCLTVPRMINEWNTKEICLGGTPDIIREWRWKMSLSPNPRLHGAQLI